MWKETSSRSLKIAPLALLLSMAVVPAAFGAEFYMKAAPTTVTMPNGGPTINMWGFVLTDSGYNPLPGQAVTAPGPKLVIPPGDSNLTVHLFNGLPPVAASAETHNISLVLIGPGAPSAVPTWTDGSTGSRSSAGQRVRSFTQETTPGSASTYMWNGLSPGTYLYESGTHPSVQVQMGLYGCVTHDFAPGQAYSGVPYNNGAVLLYSEIDPALHAAVSGGTYGAPGPGITLTSTMYYQPKYFLINGAPFPNSAAVWDHPPVAGETLLFRFLNAGLVTHVPVIQSAYWKLVAEDSSPLPYPRQTYDVLLLSGKTADAVLAPQAAALAQTTTGGYLPIYDRRLSLTNDTAEGGGMMLAMNLPCSTPVPPAVGPSLKLSKSGGSVMFHWSDISGVVGYRVYQNSSASPSTFPTLAGSALSGIAGISVPPPAGNLVYYLVDAVNGCAEGPQK